MNEVKKQVANNTGNFQRGIDQAKTQSKLNKEMQDKWNDQLESRLEIVRRNISEHVGKRDLAKMEQRLADFVEHKHMQELRDDVIPRIREFRTVVGEQTRDNY